MRLIRIAFSAVLLVAAGGASAWAGPKPCYWGWWPEHFSKMDWERRLMQDGTTPHPDQWDGSNWKPADWIAQRGGKGGKMVERFFAIGILEDQSMDDDIPVLEVGTGFFRLGGEDQKRVMALVDTVYGVTTKSPHKMFLIEDGRTGRPLGTYTVSGLTLQ